MSKFNKGMRIIARTMNYTLNNVRREAMNGEDIRLAGGLRPNRNIGMNKVSKGNW